MSKKPIQKKIATEDLEALLAELACDSDARAPQSDEEILALLKSSNPADLPAPDVAKFAALLEARRVKPCHAPSKTKAGDHPRGTIQRIIDALSQPGLPEVAAFAARKRKRSLPRRPKGKPD